MIHIACKFQRIRYICYLVKAEFDEFTFKGKNSCFTGDILTKLYYLIKFHEGLVIGYVVMVNFMDFG